MDDRKRPGPGELGAVCEHGQLARVCLICEQADELARLNLALCEAHAEIQRLRAAIAAAGIDDGSEVWPHDRRTS